MLAAPPPTCEDALPSPDPSAGIDVLVVRGEPADAAPAYRHEAQVRQDAIACQLVVQCFQQGGVERHQHLLELTEQFDPGVRRELQFAAGIVQRLAQRIRSDRQVLAIEHRSAGEHAEALAR